jgi:hypothetical protein
MVFSQNLLVRWVLVSTGVGDISDGLGGAMCAYLALSAFSAPQEV